MAPVVQRIWRSGPRKVRRTAWGYTLQVDGKQERKYDAAWTKDDAVAPLVAARRSGTVRFPSSTDHEPSGSRVI
jgi:hypothetical protein